MPKTMLTNSLNALLENPETVASTCCDAIGIPFVRAAPGWAPFARGDVLWYDCNDEICHASLRDNDGIKPILPERTEPRRTACEPFMGHYNTLQAHRPRPEMARARVWTFAKGLWI